MRLKHDKGSSRLVRNIVLAVLLGILCIGGMELAVCRFFAPETYERITEPVRAAAAAAADTGKAAVGTVAEGAKRAAGAVAGFGRTALDAAGRFFQTAGAKAAELIQQGREHWERVRAPLEEEDPLLVEPPDPMPTYYLPPGDPALTEVVELSGKQILTGGSVNVVYYCQSDEEWASQLFGSDPIGPYGCGPTAMAMVVASMTDTDTNPAVMATWAAEHGYWARRSGSYHSIIQGAAEAFGLKAEALTERTPEELRRALGGRNLAVALVGPGHFTSGGHFIILRGVTLTGDILVADPNSLDRSLEVWAPQIILDELSSARDNGAPLWVISVPDT